MRAAVANALLHRDYAVREPISLFIFPYRIELVSLGGLLPGLSPSDIGRWIIDTMLNSHPN